ncbi:peptidylprolyl isomerase [Teredinibacter turnerae]|uniref:peptidylprolyl isomerase n=2 Tax=Teredinibacter turnerae TaxID=2426 RepID=UPI000382A246|nr:peptidylprolyl isomerase [Teredinibacter turnerae]
MHRMTSIFVSVLAVFALALSLPSYSQPQMLDRVVVIVDKSVITQSELDSRIANITQRAAQAGMRLPPRDVLQKQVLDQLISETLQLNMAKRYGIEISDADLNGAIQNIKASRGWDEETFAREVRAEAANMHEFRENLRREITLQQVSQGVVRGRIRISEQEISNFLKSADAQFWISPDYRLGHILIPLPPAPSKEQTDAAEKRADAIYKQLVNGANFGEMAIAESSGPSALKGGDLGFRKSADLPTLFAEIAPTLEVGDVSKPARSQAGFHILKLMDKRGETKQVVSQAKVRHILLKPSAILPSDKARAKLEQIREQIVKGEADFAELAKDNSEDIGSKMSGGDLGWAEPDTFVGEFAQTIRDTKIGEISEPFQTQFGWHILEVLDRRQEDLTEEAIRAKARQVLTSRRFEDETQVWLQEMRDDAFIEVKI